MMKLTIFNSMNISKQCRKYNLRLWECPQFLFLVLGIVVITSSIAIYFIGVHYSQDPEIVAFIVLIVSSFLLIISYSIIRSFEKLAEVAKMKSEFIGIVSHQIRAPLSNLKWAVDLLASGKVEPVSEKQAAYLQILRENSRRMEDMVSDLLIVSRLEADNLPFKKEKASLVELVKSLISQSQPFIKASNVEIELKIEDNLPEIVFDYEKVGQAVGNILDNAIRYIGEADMPKETGNIGEANVSSEAGNIKDKGKIEVTLRKEANHLCLEVKDNGIGIPKDDQKYIFQKFFRASNASRVQAQGSGLGLYIAKSIIEKLEGKIYFVSREDQGSTFVFTLPIK
ncbi:HAMP domain-containing histidine kinase [Candidatus Parcubacteria bacterium]|nr:HAMP domain-containing histidine kinase [Patescibacteria group bacterium]MCG2688507.1 HAMP domain-containing histidine kinase [Candidatus Parcubacteria bacterium]